jgi:hypothetical protein
MDAKTKYGSQKKGSIFNKQKNTQKKKKKRQEKGRRHWIWTLSLAPTVAHR